VTTEQVFYLDVDEITPDSEQPRRNFNEDDIASTAFTIESQGIINPIEVSEDNVIVTGEIRWRAVQKAVENNPDKPELRLVKCTRWGGTAEQRFERQVIENLHHHQLSDRDRENAIVKLWKTGQYPTRSQLAKAVGLDQSRIGQILEANNFREEAPELESLQSISTADITDTRGIEEKNKRIKLLKAVSDGVIKSRDLSEVVKIAKTSGALLDKVLENKIPLARATQASETMKQIAEQGVSLTDDQKQNLADKVAEDETLLDKYKSAVLEKVRQVATAPKPTERTQAPIGRESPVNKMITVKDEVLSHYRIYLGNCDINERRWAKKVMIETRDELDLLIEMIRDG